MSVVGYGIGGAVGFATEITPGTPVAPSLYPPIISESLKATRAVVESGSITGDRSRRKMLEGLREVAGDIAMEVDGSTLGLPLYYTNGLASGALTSANLPGRISAAPTQVVSTGGTLPNGVYRYKVAAVWSRDSIVGDEGKYYVTPISAEVSATTTTGNNTVTLTFTDPTTLTPPTGWTYAGTAIYRSAVGGAADSQKFLAYQSGTGATYADSAPTTLGTIVPVSPATAMKQHVYVRAFTSGQNPLPAFTTTIVKDNDYSQQLALCRMGGAEIAFADGNSPVTCKFSLMGRDYARIANPSPSVTNLRKFMSWSATIAIDGSEEETLESMTLKIANNPDKVPGLRGIPTYRDVGYGRKQCSIDLARSFQNHNLWDKMRAATRFAIDCWSLGQGVVETDSEITISAGVTAKPLPYMMRIYAPKCILGEAGANINGPGRMVESLPAQCEVDETLGYELRIELYNLTSGYS